MKTFYQLTILLSLLIPLQAAPLPTAFKAAPARPSSEANLIIEDQEVLEACDTEQICVQGQLHNNGTKPAYQVKIRVEIGATKQGRPRHTFFEKVENSVMEPGDRQDFYLTIDRKIPVKDAKGEDKIIEVGKFNFKTVPLWSPSKPKASPPFKKPKSKL